MNRKTFLMGTIAFASFPVLSLALRVLRLNPLTSLITLCKFCSLEEIYYLGKIELKENPRNKSELKEEILKSLNIKSISGLTSFYMDDLIEKRINFDFKNDETVILNGWIISRTEARQCALSFLNKNDNNAY